MELRFTIGGTIVSNPKDWDNSTEQLRRVKEFGTTGIVKEWKLPATFTRDGYTLLRNLFLISGICQITPVLIEYRCTRLDTWETIFEGKIFINDCKFNLSACEVSVQIEDNSVAARLVNNQKIKVRLKGDKSKNGVTITPITAYDFSMFSQPSGVFDRTCIAFKLPDVFDFLITVLSDDEIDFSSTALSTTPFDGYWVTNGKSIRTEASTAYYLDDEAPYITLGELIENVSKKFNLAFWIDDSGARPVFRVEQKADTFDATNLLTLNNLPKIVEKFKTDEMYANVKIGSSTTIDDDCTLVFAQSPFITFSEENYAIIGECNIDSTLDLVNDWIIDSNIIQDVIANNNDEYDEDTFLIDGLGAAAQAANHAAPNGDFYYNKVLQNDFVILNHLGAVPNNIVQFLGYENLNCLIDSFGFGSHGNGTYQLSPFFNSITSDPGDTFSQSNRYYCKMTGIYEIEYRSAILVTSVVGGGTFVNQAYIEMNHFDRCGNLITQYLSPVAYLGVGSYGVTIAPGAINCNAGDIFLCYLNLYLAGTGGTFNYTNINPAHQFECIDSPSKDYDGYDPADYKVILDDFETPISKAQWDTIKAQPTQAITINVGSLPGNAIKGNVYDYSYNYATGMLKGTIIRSVN